MLSRLQSARQSQRGDTIVEVMIALAILGLAFALAFSTASRALGDTQNAEEHTEALQLIDTQIELIRTQAGEVPSNDPGPPRSVFLIGGTSPLNPKIYHPFCMINDTTPLEFFSHTNPDEGPGPGLWRDYTKEDFTLYPAACVHGMYYMSITYCNTSGYDYFVVQARWQGIDGRGIQAEQVEYKIHPEIPHA
jgi:prepilin-type N-terminal cleavage/methylation domain-containing protein